MEEPKKVTEEIAVEKGLEKSKALNKYGHKFS